MSNHILGNPSAAERLLQELYVDLRRRVRDWSSITRQTPQARMGYVGQHLVSVVTGFPGGRSGARGHDLELPNGQFSEIKTCYRVDQLGACGSCEAVVSSVEDECPACNSRVIIRKDDSKWLIGIRNEEEMGILFSPNSYYLVLFDFEGTDVADEHEATTITTATPNINARIWQVDPRSAGFAYCMVDYRFNIQAHSKSGAPFNLWPFSLKFQLMRPRLIYHAIIGADDSIQTKVFEGKIGLPSYFPILAFPTMLGSRANLDDDKLARFAKSHGVKIASGSKRALMLAALEEHRKATPSWTDDWLAVELSTLVYRDGIKDQLKWLPKGLR